MPVVTLVAAVHPEMPALLDELADAVARTLGLGRGDVIVTHVPAAAMAVNGIGAAGELTWPIVTLHGSDRGRDRMEAARAAAAASVRSWAERTGTAVEGVWTQWLTPMPT